MSDDPHLNPPRGFTQLLRKTGESTTSFFRRLQPTGSTSILVAGFIGSISVADEIIEKGIRGEHLTIWHGLKFLVFFAGATGHAYTLWKADPNARGK